MAEQVGISNTGSTSVTELLTSTGNVGFTTAVIAGAADATYSKGLALRNSTTAGLKAAYTNAVAVNNEAVGTGNGSTTTFDLAHSNVIAASLKGYVAGGQQNMQISVGTGTGGVDQIVFAVAPTNAAAIVADYDYYGNAVGATGACILAENVVTTTASGNMTANGLIEGHVKSALIVDSAGAAVDSYFKAQLPEVRFE